MKKFCYVCKRHVEVWKQDGKLKGFHEFGHSDKKVARLTPGLTGMAAEAHQTPSSGRR